VKYAELRSISSKRPLYHTKELEVVLAPPAGGLGKVSKSANEIAVPKEIERDCPKCRARTKWRWEGIPGSAGDVRRWPEGNGVHLQELRRGLVQCLDSPLPEGRSLHRRESRSVPAA